MQLAISEYEVGHFYDEMFTGNRSVRDGYLPVSREFASLTPAELNRRKHAVERSLMHMGITFRVYGGEDTSLERVLPFDLLPRVIEPAEWAGLERGLKQRAIAINLFLADIYGEQRILRDGVIPRRILEGSQGYRQACIGLRPPKDIYTHIIGTDLIRHNDGHYYVLEDNLRCPSGVAYVLQNRESMKRSFPGLFRSIGVRPVNDYPMQLLARLQYLSSRERPTVVVLTPGVYNSAYFEHAFLARQMGAELVEGKDLLVQNQRVYMRTTRGLQRVDVIYRRIDDDFLDPTVFRKDSMLGVKGLFEAYRSGNVALANAPGAGVADDKVVYAYIPKVIRYYLGEDPILPNVPTYVCEEEDDRRYVLENIQNLVVKAANEAGGYGMLIGPHSTAEEQEEFRKKIVSRPRDYIAQPVLSLSRVPTVIDGHLEGRHVDLRPFLIYGQDIHVLPGGLTRVALKKGSLVVNSSQGGGSKDTWVLRE